MKTAVIYARYSSDRQTEQSIEGQLRVCNEYAKRNEILIVDTYIDRAMTGTNDKRTDFQRMLRDSNKKAWDYVLVYKIDRFGRNKYELAMNKHTLKQNGIRLLSAMENIPDTPEGIILESLLEGMAEYYSAELSQKVKRGMNESRLKGYFPGGNLPLGYKKDNKKIVVDENEAAIVIWIYEQYAKGVYVKDIIAQLHAKGIYNRGRPFAKNTVHHILQVDKYIGRYVVNGQEFPNVFPTIVPQDLFDIVQRKNKLNQYGCHRQEEKFLLRKKVFCGYCGRTVNGTNGTSKNGTRKKYYACSGRYLKKGCNKKSIRKDILENIVLQAILKAFENDNAIDLLAERIYEKSKQIAEEQSVLNLLVKEQIELQKSINNLLSAIEKGIVTASTKKRLEELDERNTLLLDKIAIEKAKGKISISKKEIAKFIKKAISNEPERIMDLLVNKVILYDDKIEIMCNYTYGKGPDGERLDFLFYKQSTELHYVDKDTSVKENRLAIVQLFV